MILSRFFGHVLRLLHETWIGIALPVPYTGRMSLIMHAARSWISSALPGLTDAHAVEESRRPRWRTPSPIAASLIPHPIVQSVYSLHSGASSKQSSSYLQSPQSKIEYKQRKLESDLQILLDAQAEGLVAGLEGTSLEDENTSTGSSTPTVQSFGLGAHKRTLDRQTQKVSLRDARKGLYVTMRRLALLKAEESQQLQPELVECNSNVSRIDLWEKKRAGLQERIHKIEVGEGQQRVLQLRGQADEMQNEINEVEARLADLKRTQRKLRREAEEVENTVQAKLSSYTSSLNILEKDIARFMKENADEKAARISSGTLAKGTNAWSLESVKQSWQAEQQALTKKQEDAEVEREALDQGAVVWKDVVQEVAEFERKLREETSALAPQNRFDDGKDVANASMQSLRARMEQTTTQLESKYKLAETQNWKLLVCAIGAELEAFRKGTEILESMLGDPEDPGLGRLDGLKDDEEGAGGGPSTVNGSKARETIHDHGEEIRALDSALQNKAPAHSSGDADNDTDDDGPDPELLISHQDTDTE